mmetsp:Transcript_4353/g.15064  ORF Transcript_4353/g.15064 Transcript_4353/m.15064 type:complete len:226 (+) Transcript_4353:801-1478(+)
MPATSYETRRKSVFDGRDCVKTKALRLLCFAAESSSALGGRDSPTSARTRFTSLRKRPGRSVSPVATNVPGYSTPGAQLPLTLYASPPLLRTSLKSRPPKPFRTLFRAESATVSSSMTVVPSSPRTTVACVVPWSRMKRMEPSSLGGDGSGASVGGFSGSPSAGFHRPMVRSSVLFISLVSKSPTTPITALSGRSHRAQYARKSSDVRAPIASAVGSRASGLSAP